MKKTRILALLVALLLVATALVSCGGTMKASKLFDKDYEVPAWTTAGEVADLAGFEYKSSVGDLALFEKVEGTTLTQKVYNVATGAVVGTYANGEKVAYNVTLKNAAGVAYYQVASVDPTAEEEDRKVTNKFFSVAGAEFASTDKENAIIESVLDLVRVNEVVYRVADDGSVAKLCDYSALAGELPELYVFDGKYYYGGDDDVLCAYNEKLELCSVYEYPQYAAYNEDAIGFLGNGKVLVQYYVALPEDAEEYDVLMGDSKLQKFALTTLVLNAKNGKAKEVEADCFYDEFTSNNITTSYYRAGYWAEQGMKIDMYAEVQMITEDKQVEEETRYFEVSGSGKLGAALDRMIDGQKGLPEYVASDRYAVETKDGATYLINGKNKVIGNISNAVGEYGQVSATQNMILTADAIYDLDLNKIYDLEEKEMKVVECDFYMLGTVVLLEDKDGNTYTYNGAGDPVKVADAEVEVSVSYSTIGMFVVANESGETPSYKYYNMNGVELLSVNEKLVVKEMEFGEYMILVGEEKVYVVK